MFPRLISNPSLEDRNSKAEDSENDGDNYTDEGRHHDMSRTTSLFDPFVDQAAWSRIFDLVIEIHEPRTEMMIGDVVFEVGAVGGGFKAQAVRVKNAFGDEGAQEGLRLLVGWEEDSLYRVEGLERQLAWHVSSTMVSLHWMRIVVVEGAYNSMALPMATVGEIDWLAIRCSVRKAV